MDTIRLSRYTWMWPVVGVMCWLVGRTIRAPCSRRWTSTEGPLIRWAFLGDRMVSLAGLLGLVVGVAVVVAPAPVALEQLASSAARASTAVARRTGAALVRLVMPVPPNPAPPAGRSRPRTRG